jgi:ribose transport system ATP-binding protein
MVVREGRIAGELAASELGEEAIIMLASGVHNSSTQRQAQNVA